VALVAPASGDEPSLQSRNLDLAQPYTPIVEACNLFTYARRSLAIWPRPDGQTVSTPKCDIGQVKLPATARQNPASAINGVAHAHLTMKSCRAFDEHRWPET